MKAVALMGSYRKKDGYGFCEIFKEKMNKIESIEFEYLFLKDFKLDYCRGCMLCFSKGETFCPLKDDRDIILNKLLKADLVIFDSPVYAHQVTAIMKNFFDRFAYLFHRPCFINKYALVISTTKGTGLKETVNYLKVVKYLGFELIGTLGVKMVAFETNKKSKEQTLNQIDELSKKIMKKNNETLNKFTIDFEQLIVFNIMKEKAKYYECDKAYWEKNNWFNKDYYYDIKLNPFKKFLVKFITKKYVKNWKK